MGRPLAELVVSVDEREQLIRWARRAKSGQALALRCRIVLACAGEPDSDGKSNTEVAKDLGVSLPTVGKWRQRFIDNRLEGLHDEPRPGAPRTVTDEQVEAVVVQTLESKPKNATHWSTRSMAEATGLSQSAIVRIWRTFGLKPHRTETFKLSNDPLFIEKVRDVVGLYMSPPEKAIVLSVDEKSQIQALDRTQPGLPLGLGYTEKHTHDYIRHGTTSLFSALNVKTGEVIGQCMNRHRHQEFLKFMNTVDAAIPAEEGVTIHVIMDNYATHKTPAVRKWFTHHPRYVVHFTPTSTSWLNQVERFFAEITTKRIRRGTFNSVKQLIAAIETYLTQHNANPKPFHWTATANEILEKVSRLCKRINDSGHYRDLEFEDTLRFDVLVEGCALIEVKAVEQLFPIHKAQVISYLKLLQIPLELLINFHELCMNDGVQRVMLPEGNQTLRVELKHEATEARPGPIEQKLQPLQPGAKDNSIGSTPDSVDPLC